MQTDEMLEDEELKIAQVRFESGELFTSGEVDLSDLRFKAQFYVAVMSGETNRARDNALRLQMGVAAMSIGTKGLSHMKAASATFTVASFDQRPQAEQFADYIEQHAIALVSKPFELN